jgi:hypothetical protein
MSACSVDAGRPDISAKVCASDRRSMRPAVMKFPVVLSRSAEEGVGPTSITERARTFCRKGFTRDFPGSGPASAMRRCPAVATGVEPKTGAATYMAAWEESREVMDVDVEGWIVVVSIMVLDVRGPLAISVSTIVLSVVSLLI